MSQHLSLFTFTFRLSGVTSYHLSFFTFGLQLYFHFLICYFGLSGYCLVMHTLHYPDTALRLVYLSTTTPHSLLLVNSICCFIHYHHSTTCILSLYLYFFLLIHSHHLPRTLTLSFISTLWPALHLLYYHFELCSISFAY